MSRKGRSITLSLSSEQKERLENVALSVSAKWGENPNISELVKMIADGRVLVYLPETPITESDKDYFNEQISALEAITANLKRL